jgi:hypothetical protein
MKRIILILLLAGGVFAASAAAEGVQEEDGTITPRPSDPSYRTEQVTVSGTLELTAARPVLKSNSEQYILFYPLHLAEGLEVESGDRLTVTGHYVPGPRWAWYEEDERLLRVEIAEIGGKEYDLRSWYESRLTPGHSRRGPRGSWHHGPGRAPRQGPGQGPRW